MILKAKTKSNTRKLMWSYFCYIKQCRKNRPLFYSYWTNWFLRKRSARDGAMLFVTKVTVEMKKSNAICTCIQSANPPISQNIGIVKRKTQWMSLGDHSCKNICILNLISTNKKERGRIQNNMKHKFFSRIFLPSIRSCCVESIIHIMNFF